MKCLKCGAEIKDYENDKFCGKCGFPLKIAARDGKITKLESIFLDVQSGILLVNGKEIDNVTALNLVFDKGKYGLSVTRDEFFKAEVQGI